MKKECDMVQDLLFSYSDGVLSEASKAFVEEHLKACKECEKQLEEIQNENKETTKEIRKEIDYLKGIERKARWKVIRVIFLLLILVGVIVALVYYGNRFAIFHAMGKMETFCKQADAYYFIREYKEKQQGDVYRQKIWYANGKYKIQYEQQIKGDQPLICEEYIDTQTGKEFLLFPDLKTYQEKETTGIYEWTKGYYPIALDTLQKQCIAAFTLKMGKVQTLQNQTYYVIVKDNYEYWYNMATLLCEKVIAKYGIYSSNIKEIATPIDTETQVEYYHFYVYNVPEEEVAVPDLTEYTKEENIGIG